MARSRVVITMEYGTLWAPPPLELEVGLTNQRVRSNTRRGYRLTVMHRQYIENQVRWSHG